MHNVINDILAALQNPSPLPGLALGGSTSAAVKEIAQLLGRATKVLEYTSPVRQRLTPPSANVPRVPLQSQHVAQHIFSSN